MDCVESSRDEWDYSRPTSALEARYTVTIFVKKAPRNLVNPYSHLNCQIQNWRFDINKPIKNEKLQGKGSKEVRKLRTSNESNIPFL